MKKMLIVIVQVINKNKLFSGIGHLVLVGIRKTHNIDNNESLALWSFSFM